MNENQKSEDVTKTPSEKNNPGNSQPSSSTSQTTSVPVEDDEKREGDEFIREGHGHDYGTPVAGEDGGTEDQSSNEPKNESEETNSSKPTEQGKTQGESSTI